MSVIGIATFQGPYIYGYVTFRETENGVRISANLEGLPENAQLGWHIHEAGDLRGQGCKKACEHYNPFNKTHGGPKMGEKHVGDLGNIRSNSVGVSRRVMDADWLHLRGRYSIIGRSLVIHESEDDLGEGGNAESLKTGNSGARIGCAVIGYSGKSQLYF